MFRGVATGGEHAYFFYLNVVKTDAHLTSEGHRHLFTTYANAISGGASHMLSGMGETDTRKKSTDNHTPNEEFVQCMWAPFCHKKRVA